MSRIVVPKAIRDRFALGPGDRLEITVRPDGILLTPHIPVSPLKEVSGKLLCSREVPASAWDLDKLIDEQRNARSNEIARI